MGLFAGHPAAYHADGSTASAYLPGHRLSKPVRGWRPHRSASGATVLFHGVLHNADALSAQLGLPESDWAALYGAAVERWQDGADLRVVGDYCAIIATADELRISRSPWSAPPLHFAHFDGQTVISSVPRVLLAAGLPAELDKVRLADNLYFNLLDRRRGWYRDCHRVAGGSIVKITPDGGVKINDFYDPRSCPDIRLPRDEDYVEATEALLAEATTKALAGSQRPGIMLSGGLDSPIVAAEAMRQRPGLPLHSFTFAPCDAWQNNLPDGYMGDEREFVRAFAAMHPTLVTHFTQNPDTHFDSRLTELFTAMGGAPNHVCNFYVYHGAWAAAREARCDLMLTADFGNQTFSNEGRWAYVEYLRTGRWRQLWLALRDRPGDNRPTWQKLASLSLLRVLPGPIRRAVRNARHPQRAPINDLVSLLPASERAAANRRAIAAGAQIDHEYATSRQESCAFEYYWRDCEGAEVQQGFEQLYGIRQVDVPAYRPLAEFCAGLPTDQFIRNGQSRWLARRMAAGKLPEMQRRNTQIGWHNADWHERLTPRLAEFRAEADRIAERPELAELVDPVQLRLLLDKWPDKAPTASEGWMPLAAGLTRGVLTSRFISYATGRND